MAPISRILRPLVARLAAGCGLARVTRRFTRDQSGATAVEFGIVALPFFALLFAILETAMAFFAAEMLDTAVSNAARLVRTGQAQQQSLTAANFKNQICSELTYLFNCQAGLYVDVETYANFSSIPITSNTVMDTNGNLKTTGYSYLPGHGGDIVAVRAFYEWPVFVNKLGNNLSDLADGNHLLAATAVFRNEPFPW